MSLGTINRQRSNHFTSSTADQHLTPSGQRWSERLREVTKDSQRYEQTSFGRIYPIRREYLVSRTGFRHQYPGPSLTQDDLCTALKTLA